MNTVVINNEPTSKLVKETATKTWKLQLLTDDVPCDLTTAISVRVIIADNRHVVLDKPVEITTPANGEIEFTLSDADNTGSGNMRVELHVLFEDKKLIFPENGYIQLKVFPSLINLPHNEISKTEYQLVMQHLAEQDRDIEQAKQDVADLIDNADDRVDDFIRDGQQALDGAINTFVDDANSLLERKEEALDGLYSEHDEALTTLATDHENALNNLHDYHNDKLTNLHDTKEDILNGIIEDGQDALTNNQAEHDAQIEAHEVEHDNQINAHEVEHDNQINAHENEHDEQLSAHETEHDAQIAQHETEFDTAQSNRVTAFNSSQTGRTNTFNAQLAQQQQRVNALLNDFESQIDGTVNETLTNVFGDAFTEQNERLDTIESSVIETASLDEPINEIQNAGNFVEFKSLAGNTIQNVWVDRDSDESPLNARYDATKNTYTFETEEGGLVKNQSYNFSEMPLLAGGKTYTLMFTVVENTISGDASFIACDSYKAFMPDTGLNFSGFGVEYYNKITDLKGTIKHKFTTRQKSGDVEYAFKMYLVQNSNPAGEKIVIKDVAIVEGDWTNEYLPYLKGIKSTGEEESNLVQIKSIGKNLFDISIPANQYYNTSGLQSDTLGGKIIEINDNVVTMYESSGNSDLRINPKKIPVKAGQVITMSKTILSGKGRFILRVFDSSGNLIPITNGNFVHLAAYKGSYSTALPASFTVPNGASYMTIGFCAMDNKSDGAILNKYTNIQVEVSDTPTLYAPYVETNLNIPLNEPLRKLPDGTADTIEGTNIIRRVGKGILNGTEYWDMNQGASNTKVNTRQYFTTAFDGQVKIIGYNYKNVLSPQYANIGADVFNTDNTIGIGVFAGNNQVRISESNMTLNAFKELLASNPVTFYYSLMTPIIEPIEYNEILETYPNGHILLENNVLPTVNVDYSIALSGRLAMTETEVADNRQMIEEIQEIIPNEEIQNYFNTRIGW